ncbi:MAG: hypothetical protein GVY14_14330 [Spirochaetes bacterium]|nr:hypothetical protein [Spirochaetota bacterium]
MAKGVNAWEPLLMPHVEAQLGRRVVLGTGGLAVRVLGVPGEGASGAAAGAAGGPTGDGAGATNGSPRVRLTALLLPNFGRYDEHLPADYDGIGDVPATGEAGLDVGVRLWKGLEATARLAADALGRGHRGSYAAVGVRWRGAFPRADPDGGGGISRARLQCALGADVVAGTRHYMEAYYGVSETQARRTAFDTYDAAAGLEAVRAHVTLALPLGPRVIVASETTAMLLVGTARRSPLVRSPEQGATRLIVTYRL